MIGAAIRKTGLTDDLVKLGRKTSGGKEIIDAVEERLDTQMFKTGMEMDGLNLTRAEENGLIELNEHVYGYSDKEVGQISQQIASELTHSDVDATMKSDDTVFLKSRNMKLEGERHPETNVLFERTSLELDGTKCETVEPWFDHAGQIKLDQSEYKASRRKQRKISNTTLASDPLQQEQLKNVFSDIQIDDMKNGITPSGYVWHHAATPGVMQLVPSDIHRKTGHTGGYSIWGLGADTGGS